MFKQEIISLLSKKVRLKKQEIENLIETPKNSDLGDFAFPCFILAKKEKKSPKEIAKKLASNIKPTKNIQEIKAAGPYLNFFINKQELAKQIIKINSNYGKSNIGKKRKIVIDFSGPNIGKPMHIGHIRSTVIGDSLLRIYEFLNYKTIGINYLGDIGLHIGKLIVAYELWLDKKALQKDPVNELLRLYVKFCSKEKTKIQEGLEEPEEFQENEWTKRAKEKLKLLEVGEKRTEKIWNEIRKASGKSFDKIFNMLNIEFTETTGQSEFEKKGKQIVINALERNIAHRDGNAVYIGFGKQKKYILRGDETASYITYDLGAAVERYKKYKFDKMIYITDFRQKQHFYSLFSILKLMKYNFVEKMIHLPFGTVKFEKEILSTRKGQIILLEDVLNKTIEKAEQEIKKRKTKGSPEKVGAGSIKYIILKNEPIKDVQFSWQSALNFEGNTGPYLQYSYARASSIIKKAKKQNFNKKTNQIPKLSKEEINLIKKIDKFPEIVQETGKQMNPALTANYSYELAKIFNEFYHNCKVIGSKEEAFRLRLVDAFRTCLKNSLYLLGIEVMDEM